MLSCYFVSLAPNTGLCTYNIISRITSGIHGFTRVSMAEQSSTTTYSVVFIGSCATSVLWSAMPCHPMPSHPIPDLSCLSAPRQRRNTVLYRHRHRHRQTGCVQDVTSRHVTSLHSDSNFPESVRSARGAH
jgi:hypothetical protein